MSEMWVLLMLLVGAAVVYSGPAFDERRARRRRELDEPRARVLYLPSSCCRSSDEC